MSAFIDPENGTLSADTLKAYRDAGASRIASLRNLRRDRGRQSAAVH
jgi:hypothetical protein